MTTAGASRSSPRPRRSSIPPEDRRRRRGRPSSSDAPGPSDAEILDAALDDFGDLGFAGMSVRDLARRLGVSHTLLAHRFGTKDDLWTAAVEHGFGSIAFRLLTLVAEPPSDDLDRLREMIVAFIEAIAARPALLRIIYQEAATGGPRFEHLLRHYIDPVREAGAESLDALEASGRIRPASIGLVYFLMTHGACGPLAFPALAEGMGVYLDRSDPASIRRYAEHAADTIVAGIAVHN